MNKITSEFKGVWTALITPFDDQGNIDFDSYAKLVDEQLKAGISGLVVSGTTGEAPTLTVDEKIALVKKTRELTGNQFGVMAGTGGNCTHDSVILSQAAVDAGADSVLIVTPPYNKPSMAGLQGHFSTIAKAISVPICLYHVPGRTAQKLSAADIATLCAIEGISAVKEASADIALFAECERQCGVPILSGDDPTYLASLAVGGSGCISVASNVFPKAMVDLTEAAQAGDFERARMINRGLMPTFANLFVESNPGPTKYVLAKRGIGANYLRPPLAPVNPENGKRIDAAIAHTEKEMPAW